MAELVFDPIANAQGRGVLVDGAPYCCRKRVRFQVHAKLVQHRGQLPHFSLTADVTSGGHYISCGMLHADIRRVYGDWFADIEALHLSGADGTPMHANANGIYWLQDVAKGHPDAFSYVMKHFRISETEAKRLCARFNASIVPNAYVNNYVESCKPRWQAEAAACINKHQLTLYVRP